MGTPKTTPLPTPGGGSQKSPNESDSIQAAPGWGREGSEAHGKDTDWRRNTINIHLLQPASSHPIPGNLFSHGVADGPILQTRRPRPSRATRQPQACAELSELPALSSLQPGLPGGVHWLQSPLLVPMLGLSFSPFTRRSQDEQSWARQPLSTSGLPALGEHRLPGPLPGDGIWGRPVRSGLNFLKCKALVRIPVVPSAACAIHVLTLLVLMYSLDSSSPGIPPAPRPPNSEGVSRIFPFALRLGADPGAPTSSPGLG